MITEVGVMEVSGIQYVRVMGRLAGDGKSDIVRLNKERQGERVHIKRLCKTRKLKGCLITQALVGSALGQNVDP
jgi:hypothetical protein